MFLRKPTSAVTNYSASIQNLIDYGWKEQTTIRGEVSVLNYLGPNKRVAIITIAQKGFSASEVLISVSPFTREFDKAFGDQIKETFLNIDD